MNTFGPNLSRMYEEDSVLNFYLLLLGELKERIDIVV